MMTLQLPLARRRSPVDQLTPIVSSHQRRVSAATARSDVLRKGVRPGEQHLREFLERVDLGQQPSPRDSRLRVPHDPLVLYEAVRLHLKKARFFEDLVAFLRRHSQV